MPNFTLTTENVRKIQLDNSATYWCTMLLNYWVRIKMKHSDSRFYRTKVRLCVKRCDTNSLGYLVLKTGHVTRTLGEHRKCPRRQTNMACLSASSSTGATMFSSTGQRKHRSWMLCLFLAMCLTSERISAKPDSLKEVTDGNWEKIMTGEWMIELSVAFC